MDFETVIYLQGFFVAVLFVVATVIWYKIINENPLMYKCRHAINFFFMITLVFVIKAFVFLPDPQNIRLIIQQVLVVVISFGFLFEIKKVYKTNSLKRKRDLHQVMNLDVENPLREELSREVIKPEFQKLEGLRKLIKKENELLDKKKEKLEKWEDKLEDLNSELDIERGNLPKLKTKLRAKEKELQKLEEDLRKRNKSVERKEANYGKKDSKLNRKKEDIRKLNKQINSERKEMNKKLKTLKLLEEDIKDQRTDIRKEQIKLKRLRK